MKTIFKELIITAFVVLSGTICNAKNHKEADYDTTKCLELYITVMEEGSSLTGSTITVSEQNKVVTVLNTGLFSNTKIELKKNVRYIIEISKPGYGSKSVIISTIIPKKFTYDEVELYRRETVISLIKKDEKEIINNDAQASPVSIIYYDYQESDFTEALIMPQPQNTEMVLSKLGMLGY
jgi:hypothetical protein